MKKHSFLRLGFVLLVFGAWIAVNGCGDKVQTYHLLLECDDVIAKKSVRVDLIPIAQSQLPEWEAYSVSTYWQPQDRKRAGADKITKRFGFGQTNSYVLKTSDPEMKAKWKDWMNRRVTHLVVLAELDSVTQDAAGAADPRREIIPLNKKSLPDTSAIRILVKDGGLEYQTLEKLPKS